MVLIRRGVFRSARKSHHVGSQQNSGKTAFLTVGTDLFPY